MKIIRPRNRADFLCVEQKGKKWYNQFDKLEFDEVSIQHEDS